MALFSPRHFGHQLAPSVLFVNLNNITYNWSWASTYLNKERLTLALINCHCNELTTQQSSVFVFCLSDQLKILHVTAFDNEILSEGNTKFTRLLEQELAKQIE